MRSDELAAATHRLAEPAHSETQVTLLVEAEWRGGVLPDLSPHFAPTLYAIKQTVGFVGRQAPTALTDAQALRDAIADVVDGLR